MEKGRERGMQGSEGRAQNGGTRLSALFFPWAMSLKLEKLFFKTTVPRIPNPTWPLSILAEVFWELLFRTLTFLILDSEIYVERIIGQGQGPRPFKVVLLGIYLC